MDRSSCSNIPMLLRKQKKKKSANVFERCGFPLVFLGREWFFIIPFLALKVFLQSVENMPSVQSFVATSRRPNICEAVIALGFILISRCGCPQSMKADHQLVLVLLFNSQRTSTNSNSLHPNVWFHVHSAL